MKLILIFLPFLLSFQAQATDNGRLEVYEFVSRISQNHFKVLKSDMIPADIHCGEHFLWGEYFEALPSIPLAHRRFKFPYPSWVSYFEGCREKMEILLRTLVDRSGDVVIILERDQNKALIHFKIKELSEEEKLELKERKRDFHNEELEWMGGI